MRAMCTTSRGDCSLLLRRPAEELSAGGGGGRAGGDGSPPSPEYRLYGVLVHQGLSAHSGHYYAFVQAPGTCPLLDSPLESAFLSEIPSAFG